MLFVSVCVESQHFLSGACGNLHIGEESAFVQYQAVIPICFGVERKSLIVRQTEQRHIFQCCVCIERHLIAHGISRSVAVLGFHHKGPLAFSGLTKVNHLFLAGFHITKHGEGTTSRQLVSIVFLSRHKIRKGHSVGLNSRQLCAVLKETCAYHVIDHSGSHAVRHIDIRRICVPQEADFEVLACLPCNNRQSIVISRFVMRLVAGKRSNRHAIQIDILQLHGGSGNRQESDGILHGCALLGRHQNNGFSWSDRCRDRHLLSGCFSHGHYRACLARELHDVVGLFRLEVLHRDAVEIDHLQ